MKVLLAHNFYQSSSTSGEDVVFKNEAALLREKGIEVITYERYNDEIVAGRADTLRLTLDAIWSRKTFRDIKDLIRKEKPDIAHFHNIWYLISPSAYYACRNAGIPVVQTCHNFRFFCANGLLMRDGKICEDCVDRMPWRGVAHGCYRSSRLYTFPLALSEGLHRIGKTWSAKVDTYVALTGFGRKKIVECGLPDERVSIKPNFLLNPPDPSFHSGDSIVFIGRLAAEKGLETLIDAFQIVQHTAHKDLSLRIVGEGPLRGEIERRIKTKNIKNIELTGRKSFEEGMAILRKARFMVMPTLCYEMFPLSTIEAFACGKAVIASRLGAMEEIIQDKKTGLFFEPGDPQDLASKIKLMLDDEAVTIEMGKNARADFDAKYTAEKNFAILMDIYQRTEERQS